MSKQKTKLDKDWKDLPDSFQVVISIKELKNMMKDVIRAYLKEVENERNKLRNFCGKSTKTNARKRRTISTNKKN